LHSPTLQRAFCLRYFFRASCEYHKVKFSIIRSYILGSYCAVINSHIWHACYFGCLVIYPPVLGMRWSLRTLTRHDPWPRVSWPPIQARTPTRKTITTTQKTIWEGMQ
jgi:hypothetical protein